MKFNYTIPEIRKLCKRGSNSRLVLWLQGFGDKFYTKGQADGVGGTLSGILNMIQDGKTLDQIETEIEQGLRRLNGPQAPNGIQEEKAVECEVDSDKDGEIQD